MLLISSEFMLSSGSLLKELFALRFWEGLDRSNSGLREVSSRLNAVEEDSSRTVSRVVSASS